MDEHEAYMANEVEQGTETVYWGAVNTVDDALCDMYQHRHAGDERPELRAHICVRVLQGALHRAEHEEKRWARTDL